MRIRGEKYLRLSQGPKVGVLEANSQVNLLTSELVEARADATEASSRAQAAREAQLEMEARIERADKIIADLEKTCNTTKARATLLERENKYLAKKTATLHKNSKGQEIYSEDMTASISFYPDGDVFEINILDSPLKLDGTSDFSMRIQNMRSGKQLDGCMSQLSAQRAEKENVDSPTMRALKSQERRRPLTPLLQRTQNFHDGASAYRQ